MGVTVSPDSVTMNRGQTRTFSAMVEGTDNPNQAVQWTVEGGGSGTGITGGGILTVGVYENAGSLTARATSTMIQGNQVRQPLLYHLLLFQTLP
jgi:hypothetical protein